MHHFAPFLKKWLKIGENSGAKPKIKMHHFAPLTALKTALNRLT